MKQTNRHDVQLSNRLIVTDVRLFKSIVNPLTPKSDQFEISPTASPEI